MAMSRIYIGTSSWSDFEDFYPEDLPSNQQITYYAQRFSVVEINSTYYRLMPTRNFALWAERTPPEFVFDVKVYRQLTFHDRDEPPTGDVHEQFSASVQPLRDAGKLGALHFQFAPWVKHSEENLDYIVSLRDLYSDDPLSVEFRHRSWYDSDYHPVTVQALREASIGLTVVDEPQVGSGTVPTVVEVTAPELAIARLHGRNAKTWYGRFENASQRFDYLYSEQELREWAPNVKAMAEAAEVVHVLFNNNYNDYALENARQMRMILRQELPEAEVVASPEESS
jgi:uncharacterized protein YecE (DUF72 family)